MNDPRVLLIALGNPLRGDDGVAEQVVELLPEIPGVCTRTGLQLAPEDSADLAPYELVIFADADAGAAEVRIECVGTEVSHPTLTHHHHPASIVALARKQFGFEGKAVLCRIPAQDFTPGAPLSPEANAAARSAASRILELLLHQTRE